jgi:5-methylcytosine-specific restriction endonuclease McrA
MFNKKVVHLSGLRPRKPKREFSLTTTAKKKIKEEAIERKCEVCRTKKKLDDLQVHHITKQSKGGTHIQSNLVVVCRTCHRHKIHALGDKKQSYMRQIVKRRGKKKTSKISKILRDSRRLQEERLERDYKNNKITRNEYDKFMKDALRIYGIG